MQRLVSIVSMFISVASMLSCSSSGEKQHHVVTDAPTVFSQLINDEMTGFERAVVLRRAVADTLHSGYTTDSLCLNFASIPFSEFSVDTFLYRFGSNGAAKCGLAASILAKTLNDNGMEAYTYNFGFLDTRLTHVVVIAKTEEGVWTLHDPFFNYSLTDSTSQPKDFFALLMELKQGIIQNSKVMTDTVERDVLVNLSDESFKLLPEPCREHIIRSSSFNEDSTSIKMPVCYGCAWDSAVCGSIDFIKIMEDLLAQHGFPKNFLFAIPQQINGLWGPYPNEVQLRIDSALKSE